MWKSPALPLDPHQNLTISHFGRQEEIVSLLDASKFLLVIDELWKNWHQPKNVTQHQGFLTHKCKKQAKH